MPAVKPSVVVGKVREDKNVNAGYNAATEEYVDMIKAGIIDPTKVSRTALQNAASAAALMLTTEVMVTDILKRRRNPWAVAGMATAMAWKGCTNTLSSDSCGSNEGLGGEPPGPFLC